MFSLTACLPHVTTPINIARERPYSKGVRRCLHAGANAASLRFLDERNSPPPVIGTTGATGTAEGLDIGKRAAETMHSHARHVIGNTSGAIIASPCCPRAV